MSTCMCELMTHMWLHGQKWASERGLRASCCVGGLIA